MVNETVVGSYFSNSENNTDPPSINFVDEIANIKALIYISLKPRVYEYFIFQVENSSMIWVGFELPNWNFFFPMKMYNQDQNKTFCIEVCSPTTNAFRK